ncbi:TetR/AcrR family transcriptional regulator [Amycolatopsis acidicola]|uniref:TetR/AcrR family transcriptional regulator n=1 Tax=Amycolatopsis acidicola TaxID=2596893 RepID=A0A5N0UWI5_9PSEU|nr:TetR/AcrR family transcriptional regulator [Amycolatopsis acidicola]KAA9155300.1 TetR/AcrR family transcriptional regulator [Amycolatopsis acidicola]
MTKRPRSGPRRDPLAHEAILSAARDLVAEVGYDQATVEAIAARAGVGKMTVYRWWPNKAAVVTEAVADRLAPPPVPDTGSVGEDALEYLRGLVRTLTLLGDPTVVAGALAERGEDGRMALRDILRDRFEPGTQLLRRGVERGELPADLPVAAIVESWAGYALYRIVFLQEEPSDTDLRELAGLLPVRS